MTEISEYIFKKTYHYNKSKFVRKIYFTNFWPDSDRCNNCNFYTCPSCNNCEQCNYYSLINDFSKFCYKSYIQCSCGEYYCMGCGFIQHELYKEKTKPDKVKNLNTFNDKTWLTISDFPIDNDIRYLNNRSVIIYHNFDSDIDRYNNYQCHTPECDIFKNPFKSFNILI